MDWLHKSDPSTSTRTHCLGYRIRRVFSAARSKIRKDVWHQGHVFLKLTKSLLSVLHLFAPFAVVTYVGFKGENRQQLIGAAWFAVSYISVVFVAGVFHKFHESTRNDKLRVASRNEARASWEKLQRKLRLLLESTSSPDDHRLRDEAKEQIVNWARQMLVQRTQEFVEPPVISVFLFSNDNCSTLKACVRTEYADRRPQVTLQGSILFWATRLGKKVIVPCSDYGWHPFDYHYSRTKSKVLLPLIEFVDDGLDCCEYCYGIISVESVNPFHFDSRKWQDIDDVAELLISLVQLVVGKPQFKRKIDTT